MTPNRHLNLLEPPYYTVVVLVQIAGVNVAPLSATQIKSKRSNSAGNQNFVKTKGSLLTSLQFRRIFEVPGSESK